MKKMKNIRKTFEKHQFLAPKIEISLDEMKSLYRNHRKQIKVFFQRKYLKQTVSVDQSSAHRKNLVWIIKIESLHHHTMVCIQVLIPSDHERIYFAFWKNVFSSFIVILNFLCHKNANANEFAWLAVQSFISFQRKSQISWNRQFEKTKPLFQQPTAIFLIMMGLLCHLKIALNNRFNGLTLGLEQNIKQWLIEVFQVDFFSKKIGYKLLLIVLNGTTEHCWMLMFVVLYSFLIIVHDLSKRLSFL